MKNIYKSLSIATFAFAICNPPVNALSPYQVGVGISDMTGEAAEVGMMGYASIDQKTSGISQRERARAFAIDDDKGNSLLMVVIDGGMIFQSVHQEVLRKLAHRYGGKYNQNNVILMGTHTHAGPGGQSHYALYNITILGFQKTEFDVQVNGIMEAIDKAVSSKAPGDILFNQGELTNASRNRSATAFMANPASDQAVFPLQIDPLMTTLTFKHADKAIGTIAMFATHGTSLTNTNTLISGDNKGYASYYWEHDIAGGRYRKEPIPFVAAFPQTNAGDMSPNLNLKPGSGPTEDEFENTRIIGERQAKMAISLSSSATDSIGTGLDYRMRYIDMSSIQIMPEYTPDGQIHITCPAALGASFAAGSSEDGPGPAGIAKESDKNPFLAAIGGLVFHVSQDMKRCHGAKQIFLPVGYIRPTPWVPNILPISLVRIGSLYLASLPAEPTIMTGYRIRRQLAKTLGVDISKVQVLGYANAYTNYITTPEEYSTQQYEGGSTLFGPYTQSAYMQELDKLAQDMRAGRPSISLLSPPDLSCCQLNFQTGVVFDAPAFGKKFGSVLTNAKSHYKPGELVRVRFQTGHPKNNLRRNDTFLEVQHWNGYQWEVVADDGDWSTRYQWKRTIGAESVAEISWKIPLDTPSGQYRIVHYGDAKKAVLGVIKSFTGASSSFLVTP